MTAPERIWAVYWGTDGAVINGAWADTVRHFGGGVEYILATPEALAASPEVHALVMAERERCARILAAGSALIARWDSQDWKSGHTLDFITQLREAIRAGTEGGE